MYGTLHFTSGWGRFFFRSHLIDFVWCSSEATGARFVSFSLTFSAFSVSVSLPLIYDCGGKEEDLLL